MAAHNWRTLRSRGLDKGHADLMALSSMHVVLDMAEAMGNDSAVHGVKTESEARAALSEFHDTLYMPDRFEAQLVNDPVGPPPGFEDNATEASWDAFAAAINGR